MTRQELYDFHKNVFVPIYHAGRFGGRNIPLNASVYKSWTKEKLQAAYNMNKQAIETLVEQEKTEQETTGNLETMATPSESAEAIVEDIETVTTPEQSSFETASDTLEPEQTTQPTVVATPKNKTVLNSFESLYRQFVPKRSTRPAIGFSPVVAVSDRRKSGKQFKAV